MREVVVTVRRRAYGWDEWQYSYIDGESEAEAKEDALRLAASDYPDDTWDDHWDMPEVVNVEVWEDDDEEDE